MNECMCPLSLFLFVAIFPQFLAIVGKDLIFRRQLQKTVLKLGGEKSGLYVKDMCGMREYGHKEMIKMSPLGREMLQRIEIEF